MSSLNDTHSLSHTKWNCKYHVVFAPKYRRKEFYGSKRLEIGAFLRELCGWKEVNIYVVNNIVSFVNRGFAFCIKSVLNLTTLV